MKSESAIKFKYYHDQNFQISSIHCFILNKRDVIQYAKKKVNLLGEICKIFLSFDIVFRIGIPFGADFWTKIGNSDHIVYNRRDLTLSCCLTETLTKQVPKRWLVCYWRKVSFLCIF